MTGFLALAVFLGVIWGFAALVGGDSGSDPEVSNTEPVDRWSEAYVVCQDFVEDRLRAPGTADFSFGSREYVTTLGGDRYRVEAYVDAENAFGAMLRSDFTCTVEYRSGDRWRLRNLEITER